MNANKFVLLPVIMILAAALTACAKSPAEEAAATTAQTMPAPVPVETIASEKDVLTQEERIEYEHLMKTIDEGDSAGFAEILLEGNVSENLHGYLIQEDPLLTDRLVLDAMVQYARTGNLKSLVLLRLNGFVSNNCFLDYWEVMGSLLPEEANTDASIDSYLVHELHMAYLRDAYNIRCFREMRESGVLTDELHNALINALGFDYMDNSTVEENQFSPLYMLTEPEKAAYDSVLEFIDQGDYMSVANGMLAGEITPAVYEKLRNEDAEVLDYVIAQSMAGLAEDCRFQELLQLCAGGYVSEYCFECYWEMEGFEIPEMRSANDYLLYELEQIFCQNENGAQLLHQIWKSGLLGDDIHQQLISRLGVDYTKSA